MSRPARLRLTTRLALAALVIGSVGWALGATAIRTSADDALRDEAKRTSVAVAARLAGELDARVRSFALLLHVVGTDPAITALSPAATTELAVALSATPDLDSLLLRDGDGRVVAGVATDRLVDAASRPPRPGLVAGLDPGREQIELAADRHGTIDVVVPVERPPGTVVGALEATVPIELVVRSLDLGGLGRSARAIVVGPDGTILASPERDQVVRRERYPVEALADDAGTLVRDGATLIAGAAAPAAFPGLVIIERSETDALGAARTELSRLSLLLAAVVGSTVLAILVMGNRLTRPLAGLVGTLRRIGSGQRDARAEVRGSAEFQAVATEVNRMADALDDRLRELESTQADLATAEQRFRTAFDAAPVAMVLQDAVGRVLRINPAWRELSGRDGDDLRHTSWESLAHHDEHAGLIAAFEEAMREGRRVFQCETRFLHAGGTALPVLASVAIVPDRDGEPAGFITHLVDLSELREAEARFRRIVESSPDVLIILALDGTIELVSRRVREMFGYEPGELEGQMVELLVPRQLWVHHVEQRAAFARAPTTREMSTAGDVVGVRKDGKLISISVELTPLDIGAETKILAAVRDVTERRAGERATRRLQEMQLLQRQAMEVNDNVVQGLTIARWSFELGRTDDARRAIERTLDAARTLVDSMLAASGEIEPGALRRQRPAMLDQ